ERAERCSPRVKAPPKSYSAVRLRNGGSAHDLSHQKAGHRLRGVARHLRVLLLSFCCAGFPGHPGGVDVVDITGRFTIGDYETQPVNLTPALCISLISVVFFALLKTGGL